VTISAPGVCSLSLGVDTEHDHFLGTREEQQSVDYGACALAACIPGDEGTFTQRLGRTGVGRDKHRPVSAQCDFTRDGVRTPVGIGLTDHDKIGVAGMGDDYVLGEAVVAAPFASHAVSFEDFFEGALQGTGVASGAFAVFRLNFGQASDRLGEHHGRLKWRYDEQADEMSVVTGGKTGSQIQTSGARGT